jgi:hypothetical protein
MSRSYTPLSTTASLACNGTDLLLLFTPVLGLDELIFPPIPSDRLCGLVVSVADCKHTGPGFDSRALLWIFLRELGLERDPLSLVIG